MNKKIIVALLLVCSCLPEIAMAKDSEDSLPVQLRDVRLGMSRADFFKVRPRIAEEFSGDPRQANRRGGLFREEFPAGDFDSAVYIFKDEKLTAISLYVTKDRDLTTEKRRQRIYKGCVGKWGKAQKKVGRMSAASKNVQDRSPAAVWSTAGVRSILIVPRGKKAKAPKIVLAILATDTQESPAFQEEAVSDQEKEIAFKEAGLVD